MTLETQRQAISRTPQVALLIFLDSCRLLSGVAPCTASETGDDKCYNTRSTCNDIPNYNKVVNFDFADWTATDPDDWTVTETGTGSVEESGALEECRLIAGNGTAIIEQTLLTVGVKYQVKFTVVSITGELTVDDGSASIGDITTTGIKTFEFIATDTDLRFVADDTADDIVIDNVFLKELKVYKFSKKGAPLPFPGEIIRPYLTKDPSYLATEIDVRKAISHNAHVTLELQDEPDNDIGIDKYVTERTAFPNAAGTFFKKLLARNIYYKGREVLIKNGFQ